MKYYLFRSENLLACWPVGLWACGPVGEAHAKQEGYLELRVHGGTNVTRVQRIGAVDG